MDRAFFVHGRFRIKADLAVSIQWRSSCWCPCIISALLLGVCISATEVLVTPKYMNELYGIIAIFGIWDHSYRGRLIFGNSHLVAGDGEEAELCGLA